MSEANKKLVGQPPALTTLYTHKGRFFIIMRTFFSASLVVSFNWPALCFTLRDHVRKTTTPLLGYVESLAVPGPGKPPGKILVNCGYCLRKFIANPPCMSPTQVTFQL